MKKDSKYIQLPPIEKNVDSRVVQAIWSYLKLPEKARIQVHDEIKRMYGKSVNSIEPMEEECEKIEYSEIAEFEMTMISVIGGIIEEACDLACWVYGKKYIDEWPIEKMLEQCPTAADFIVLINAMFERHIENDEPQNLS